jgi:hypothetical protein
MNSGVKELMSELIKKDELKIAQDACSKDRKMIFKKL